MSKQKTAKVPQIRFKGFEDEWLEEPLLSRISGVIDFRGRTPKKLGLDWSPSGYLALSALNVKDGYIDRYADAHYGDEELYTKWMKGNELHCNQVLFTTEAPMGNVAQIPDTQKYILSQRTIAFVTDAARLSEDYLAVLLKSPNVFGALLARSSGGTAKGVSQKSLSSLHVRVSDELAEQIQIGGYFRELDNLIGLHQRKHDKLVTLKKAMLQKMFPQPGTTTPEIRFKGFKEDWEEKKLSELCDLFTDGDWIESKDQSASGIRLLQTGNVGVNEFIDKADKARWISLDTFERLKCEEVFAGDILISRLPEPAGRACIVPKLSHRVITAVDCTIVRTAKGCDPAFLVQHCSLDSYFETVNNYLGGGTRQRISRSALGNFVVKIPQFEEQQKIGIYFRTLDELIAQHATQLQKLQQIKSACLARMFV